MGHHYQLDLLFSTFAEIQLCEHCRHVYALFVLPHRTAHKLLIIKANHFRILQSCICKNSEVKILALAGAMKGLLLSRLCMYLYLSRFVFAKIQACAHWPPSPRGLLHPKFESSTASVVPLPLPLPTKSQHPFQSIIIFINQVDFMIITIIITLVIQHSATPCTITNHQT